MAYTKKYFGEQRSPTFPLDYTTASTPPKYSQGYGSGISFPSAIRGTDPAAKGNLAYLEPRKCAWWQGI